MRFCLAGVQYYSDLNQPVTKAEADAIGHIVDSAVTAVLPGAQITLIGGFRRYKILFLFIDKGRYTVCIIL